MSVYTSKTGLSSILKTYSPAEREKTKSAIINKVRFEMPKRKGLEEAINEMYENNDEEPLTNFIDFLKNCDLSDAEFISTFKAAHKLLHQISRPEFANILETLLKSSQWIKRNAECRKIFVDFCLDIVVIHSKYIHIIIPSLIQMWIPNENDKDDWVLGTPKNGVLEELQCIHKLLERLLTTIPISCNVALETMEKSFPYLKRPSYVLAGYIHNLLWLLEYKPMFTEYVLQLLVHHLVLMDVHAPRSLIEESEMDDENSDCEEDNNMKEEMFEMDDCNEKEEAQLIMNHEIAASLDFCLEKVYVFLKSRAGSLNELTTNVDAFDFSKILLNTFKKEVLPKHNTHHVQFIMFYYCSFKETLAEQFLSWLWEEIKNPNVSAIIRQASVGYMASFLARAKYLPISIVRHYLKELCDWSHQYIMRSDQCRSNISLKANLVFYTICQAIFYVIAFRSRDLTVDSKSLRFLQSLQLSGLVTSAFNPLRVCLQTVATAFAGVTRAYQLAYCHAILERNARRKLATVYSNETETPEDTLDTFFPFDPYLLKLSGRRIEPHYLQYRPSEAEEHSAQHHYSTHQSTSTTIIGRKRCESEMIDDNEIDDFLIADKRCRLHDLARKNSDREAEFTYGLSPGFHI